MGGSYKTLWRVFPQHFSNEHGSSSPVKVISNSAHVQGTHQLRIPFRQLRSSHPLAWSLVTRLLSSFQEFVVLSCSYLCLNWQIFRAFFANFKAFKRTQVHSKQAYKRGYDNFRLHQTDNAKLLNTSESKNSAPSNQIFWYEGAQMWPMKRQHRWPAVVVTSKTSSKDSRSFLEVWLQV